MRSELLFKAYHGKYGMKPISSKVIDSIDNVCNYLIAHTDEQSAVSNMNGFREWCNTAIAETDEQGKIVRCPLNGNWDNVCYEIHSYFMYVWEKCKENGCKSSPFAYAHKWLCGRDDSFAFPVDCSLMPFHVISAKDWCCASLGVQDVKTDAVRVGFQRKSGWELDELYAHLQDNGVILDPKNPNRKTIGGRMTKVDVSFNSFVRCIDSADLSFLYKKNNKTLVQFLINQLSEGYGQNEDIWFNEACNSIGAKYNSVKSCSGVNRLGKKIADFYRGIVGSFRHKK